MKIAIIGIGALGSLFAARLSPFGAIVMVGSWTPQIRALRERGLILVHVDGSASQHRIPVTENAAQARPVDLALVVVKSYQTEKAAQAAAAALAPDGVALTLQNGWSNLETLAATLGARRALAGTTSEGATLLRPGVVRHAGHGATFLARPKEETAARRIKQLLTWLEEGGFRTALADDVRALLWGKLAVNAAINPLTALLHVPNGYLLQNGAAREIMHRAARETAAVAAAQGIALPYADAAARAEQVARETAGNRSSMLQDLENGRQTEIEAITGAVVRSADKHAVPAPVNAALLRLFQRVAAGEGWQEVIPSLQPDVQPLFAALSGSE